MGGRVMAHLTDGQISALRTFLNSAENDTWVRSEDVTDNLIREAVAATGTGHNIDVFSVAAHLVTLLNAQAPTTVARLALGYGRDSVLDDALPENLAKINTGPVTEVAADAPRDDLDLSINVEVPTTLLHQWRQAREEMVKTATAFLDLNREMHALVDAAETAHNQEEERAEREADEEEQREQDALHGPREFYLQGGHYERNPRKRTVHLLTCSLVPEVVANDFTNSDRIRAADVHVLSTPCVMCHPVERLNVLTSPTWSEQREAMITESRQARAEKSEAALHHRPEISHRMVAYAARKMRLAWNDGVYQRHGFTWDGWVDWERDERTEARLHMVRYDDLENTDFVSRCAAIGYIGRTEVHSDTVYYFMKKMTKAEIKARDAALKNAQEAETGS